MIAIDLGSYLRGLSHVPLSCLAEEIQLLVERLGSMFSLCHQAAWWHRAVSRGHVTFLSSCLAWMLVAFGRQAAWRLGAIGMVSSSWLAALCNQCLFVLALVDMFDLTLWLDAARRRRLAMRMCFWRSRAYVARGDFVPFVASRLRLLPVVDVRFGSS